ncbi:hypothetical protein JT358_11325 [Micrococcales bacterium 31B]|nr:hypothetical protein [Micrococcales bacterium 31B]
MRRKIDPVAGDAALRAWREANPSGGFAAGGAGPDRGGARVAAREVDRPTLATCVRYLLEEFGARHPGTSVEVRVPPFGVVQAIAGVRHTRGTPPAVIEAEPHAWVAVALGDLTWAEALASGAIRASGERTELGDLLPLA